MEDPTPYYTTKWDDVVAVQTGERTWAVTRPLCPGWHITETLAQRRVEQDWIQNAPQSLQDTPYEFRLWKMTNNRRS